MKFYQQLLLISVLAAIFLIRKVAANDYPITVAASGQLHFIENKGQFRQQVLYDAKIPGGDLFLEKNTFTYYVFDHNDLKRMHPLHEDSIILHGHAWKEIFLGANPDPKTISISPSSTYYNYFIGNDPSHWASKVHEYAQVSYDELYTGIDMNVYGFGPNLKYDLIVEPFVDPSQIQIEFDGVSKLSTQSGNLVIGTSIGDFIEQKPYAYQVVNGMRKSVSCKFSVKGTIVTFNVTGNYDRSIPLVIDPTLIFSTFTGSTADNFGYTATYDATGAMYLGGLVHGAGYPATTGSVQLTYAGGTGPFPTGNGNNYACDDAIMKLSAMGNAVLWATYLGGSDNETPHSLVTDNNGDLIIYGRTWSTDFPVTSTAYDQSYNGDGDINVTKISGDGSTLMGSTYIGGTGMDGVNDNPTEPGHGNLKVNYGDDARGEVMNDASNNIYVATCTMSSNFPTTPTGYQTSSGGNQDGCVFKLNPDCSSLLWSTYLGGSSDDACYSLDVYNGEVYTAGGTMSSNFPATSGTLHSSFQGGTMDGFIAHLSSDGSSLLQSSFIGTSSDDQAYFVKIDGGSNVYLYGQTNGNYPVTPGTYSNPNSGQFIHKLDPALSSTIYSTVFGNGNGSPNISPAAFAVDTCENIYLSGWGGSVYSAWSWFDHNMQNMPITVDALQSTTDGTDFYIAVFKKNMTQLQYATYFGGNMPQDQAPEHIDGGTSRFDRNGNIYQAICGGCGGYSSVPTTPGAWSQTNNSTNCNEVGVKMEVNLFIVTAALQAFPTATGCVPLTVQFTNNSVNATQFFWDFGDGGTSTVTNPTHTFTDTGTYLIMLIASDPTACVPFDTAYTSVVVYNTTVDASYTFDTLDFCDSIKAILSATSSNIATTFTWDFGDSTSAFGPNVNHTYTVPGFYTITMIANDPTACNPLDTFTETIDFTHLVIASLTQEDYFGCPPFTIQFQDNGYGGITFFWDFGDGTTSTDPSPTHTYGNPGTYYGTFIASDPAACNPNDTVQFTVTVFDFPPQAAFTANPTIIIDYNSEVHFTNQSQGATHYLWLFGDGDTSTAENPSHWYILSGDYLACLIAFNEGGCPDTACVQIQVDLIPAIDVPNGFSPNGDGQNDVLYVKGQDVKNMDFRVYNRWGELVFETNDINIGWNGIYKGKPQEMEVYVWTLSATFSNGKATVKNGNVTLLR
ncbi:MAG TPA: PKD domain-containing protein [Chitinophagales bacterium]|nr:PKD domain-containing protein [Chitinophagales bacterium]